MNVCFLPSRRPWCRVAPLSLLRKAVCIGGALFSLAPSLLATLRTYQAAVTNESSLISYYTFDQSTADDVFGTNPGVMKGTARVAEGLGGDLGLMLDGRGWVTLGVVPDFAFTDGTGTVEAWVKADTGLFRQNRYVPCLIATQDADKADWALNLDTSADTFGIWNGTQWNANGASGPLPLVDPYAAGPSGGNWHHVAVVFDNTTGTPWTLFYWDGRPAGQVQEGPSGLSAGTQLGSSAGDRPDEAWIGMLDEVAFYADPLAPEVILAHYQSFFAETTPVIIRPPSGGRFLTGVTAALEVGALGNDLTYQWFKGTEPIPLATGARLQWDAVSPADAGTYHVVVSGVPPAAGTRSADVTVEVEVAPPVALAAYQSAVRATPGLVSYYTFDRIDASDSVGAHDGQPAGQPTFREGVGGAPGAGVYLDGFSWIRFGEVSDFDFTEGNGTIEAWIQADWRATIPPSEIFMSNPCLFADRDGDPVNWSVHVTRDRLGIGVWNGSSFEPQLIPYAGTHWHHVAVVWEGLPSLTTTFFWDGRPLGQTSQGLSGGPHTFQIGSSGDAALMEPWVGMVDEVAVYGVALQGDAIQAHYDALFHGAMPTFLTQPVGGGLLPGSSRTLTAWAAGADPAYQWFKDGSPIPGAVEPGLPIQDATLNDAGVYSVVVTTSAGSATSDAVRIGVGSQQADYQAAVLAEPSLIAYYTFDSGDARDSKGKHDGVAVGAPAYDVGVGQGTDQCLVLDGGSSIDLGVVPAFEFANGTGTIEGWIRMDWDDAAVSYTPCLIANRDGAEINWSMNALPDRSQIGDFDGGAYMIVPFPGRVDGWHHIAITFGGGAAAITLVTYYWDGNLIGQWNQDVGIKAGLPAQLGSSAAGVTSEGWIGSLDEIAVYRVDLGADTIRAHYLAMTSPAPKPVLTWTQEGGHLILQWPSDLDGYTLQTTQDLATPSWVALVGVLQNRVAVDASKGAGFYRLAR